MKTRILKKHVGHSVDFKGEGDSVWNGCIEMVAHGIATVRYWATRRDGTTLAEGFVIRFPVSDKRIVEVY